MCDDFDYGCETLGSIYDSFNDFKKLSNSIINVVQKDGQVRIDMIESKEDFEKFKDYKYLTKQNNSIVLEEK